MTIERIKQFAKKKEWQYLADGWDHIVFTNTDRSCVFRMPKVFSDRDTFDLELALLPQLQDLGIVVPQPTLKNESGFFWTEYPFVKGKSLFSVFGSLRTDALRQVCQSLQKLHSITQVDANVPIKDTRDRYKNRLDNINTVLKPLLYVSELAYCKDVLQRVLDLLPERQANTLSHGDAHLEHIYTDGDEVSLIDWSDVMITDPAREFQYLLRELPEETHQTLFESYGCGPDKMFWERAKMYVFTHTVDVLFILIDGTKKDMIPSFVERVKRDMKAWEEGKIPTS